MGGVNKGLVSFNGEPLVMSAIKRLRPQVAELLISANSDLDVYRSFGCEVLSDAFSGHVGPLAGLHAALLASRYPVVVAVPCDSPFFPLDLVARLFEAQQNSGADMVIVQTSGHFHPVFCLCHRRIAPHLGDFIASGGRRVMEWYASVKGIAVAFDDQKAAFRNINTMEELSGAMG